MTGFTFCGKHSDAYGIIVTDIKRFVKAQKNASAITIPGRHGSYYITDNTYSDINIIVSCAYIGHAAQKARAIGQWLSGSGELIFDTEPDKIYNAHVFEAIDTKELASLKEFDITFTAFPFALSAIRQQDFIIAGNPESLIVVSGGTMETPAKIYIKNTGDKNVTGIKITIKKRCSI
jgi:predicted phage tail component-like protein